MGMNLRQRLVDLIYLLVLVAIVLGGIEVGWRLREHHQLVDSLLNVLRQQQQVPQQPKPPQP